MASIGHVAVGLAAARSYEGNRRSSWPELFFWSALSLFPDIDVVGFFRGVPYGAPWGHRGATHSLAFAVTGGILIGLVARTSGLAARWFKRPPLQVALFATLVLASHGLLDSLTDGGLGAALLWPFSLKRFFAPWQPIPVAPIGPDFFTLEGATVALSELALFLPLWLFAFRVRVRAPAIALWVVLVWLIGSSDRVHDRVMGVLVRDDTRFAPGYSEDAFRAMTIGDREDAVRARLGEPLFDSILYLPEGYDMASIMIGQVPPAGCFGAGVKAGVVQDTHDAAICRSRGVVEGMSKTDMFRILGAPSGSCAQYSDSPNRRFRLRMVCFSHGKVEMIFRRWT